MNGLNSLNDPARALRAVTPSDTAMLPDGTCRALTCGVSGTATVLADGDTVAVQIYLNAGSAMSVQAKQVKATGTTASGIVAMY